MDISLLKPYDYFEALQYRYKMVREYPFISVFSIGKSVMGREIPAFILGNTEEHALFIGGVHGNEGFTTALLMTFFKELCEGVKTDDSIEGLKVRRALSGRGLIIIPCLNPDGCEIASRGKAALGNMQSALRPLTKDNYSDFSLNARGTDLDLIFSALPLKEPESAALYSFCEKNDIRHAVIFGKGSGEIVMPPIDRASQRCARMAEIMISSTGYGVSYSKEETRHIGFTDWFSAKYSKPSFKILPPPPKAESDTEYIKIYKELREFMMLTAIM